MRKFIGFVAIFITITLVLQVTLVQNIFAPTKAAESYVKSTYFNRPVNYLWNLAFVQMELDLQGHLIYAIRLTELLCELAPPVVVDKPVLEDSKDEIVEDTEEALPTPTTYIVEKGDTLNSIADMFSVKAIDIVGANGILNVDRLTVGQRLLIPDITGILDKEETTQKRYTVTQLSQLYRSTFYHRGPGDIKAVALTFDDGPDSTYTGQVLDVLAEYEVPGTFFFMGSRVEKHPDVVQRVVDEGHVLGNHSWSHPDFRRLSSQQLTYEIMATENILARITGLKTALVRPPYGAVSYDALATLKELDYRTINWSVDSVDWRDQDARRIINNTLPDVRPGGILLFHTAGGKGQSFATTVEALPQIIEILQGQGYTFMTVDQLLSVPAYK